MLSKLLLTLLISSQLLSPTVTDNSGQVLGVQQGGDIIQGPERIINKNLGVKISASAGIVIDVETGKILFSKNAHQPRTIASITKLMTTLVFLSTNPDLNQETEIISQDINNVGKSALFLNEKVKLENLLYLSLIKSDNAATLALVRATGIPKDEFINKMNIKAKGMGLSNTKFADPVGLSKNNISTAYEVSQILNLAMRHSLIKKILVIENYSFTSISGNSHHVKNTNKLLNSYLNVLGGKTGYINESGYCFTGLIKNNKAKFITVILDAPSADERFNDTKRMVEWTSNNYGW